MKEIKLDVKFLNIRHLRVFIEVARTHSISAAATRTHLSQPAVTQAISKLESSLNVALFQRNNIGFYTTKIGGVFEQRVERILRQLRLGAKLSYRASNKEKIGGFSNFDELVTAAQLRALVAVGKTLSYSVAGREIGLSQPTVHRSVNNLEALSGIKLVRRISSGTEPTVAGHKLIKHIKLAYSELQQALNEISEFNGRDTTNLIIGSLPLARSHILPKAVHSMIQHSKDVQISIVDGRYSELLRGLRNGEIDIIIGALRDPPPADDVVQEILFDDALVIVAGRSHPLVGRNDINIKSTMAYHWAAPPRATPGGAYLFETLRIQEMSQTPVRVVSSSLIFLRGLLAQGDYLSIISRHQINEEINLGTLVPLSIPLKNSERPIGLTLRKEWQPTATQSRFLCLLRKIGKCSHITT